jgi:peptidoglycan/xylan/chitin deacetylase (PgdA/CDA1 family)
MVRRQAKNALTRSGLSGVVRFFNRGRGLILMYHGIVADSVSQEWNQVTQDAFDMQMAFLKKKYTVVPLGDLVDLIAAGRLPPYTASITFDDGYRSVHDLAYPVLVRHQLPATVYLVTSFVGSERHRYLWTDHITALLFSCRQTALDLSSVDLGRYELGSPSAVLTARREIANRLKLVPDIRRRTVLDRLIEDHGTAIDHERFRIYHPMTWEEVQQLGTGGLVTIGAHTRTHPILSRIPASSLDAEIIGSLEDIQVHFGTRPRHFAYPNGRLIDVTGDAVATARRHFASATTTVRGLNAPRLDPHLLRRIGIGGSLTMDEFSALLSGLYFPGR